jgi:hypothetical protein
MFLKLNLIFQKCIHSPSLKGDFFAPLPKELELFKPKSKQNKNKGFTL